MATVFDGKKTSEALLRRLRRRVDALRKRGCIPSCGILIVGKNRPSLLYVEKKRITGESIGIKMMVKHLSASSNTASVLRAVQFLTTETHGLIIQLPLPRHIHTQKILSALPPNKDIDCLTEENLGKVLLGNPFVIPPTAGAILDILKKAVPRLQGKYIVLLGAGRLVGKPLLPLLLERGATVTICQSATKNFRKYTKEADIVISGIGKSQILRGSDIQKGALVIDAGVSVENGDVFGDIHIPSIKKMASFYTPTPGGVGPLTVLKLLENVVQLAEA